jgi:hypothetical protein
MHCMNDVASNPSSCGRSWSLLSKDIQDLLDKRICFNVSVIQDQSSMYIHEHLHDTHERDAASALAGINTPNATKFSLYQTMRVQQSNQTY